MSALSAVAVDRMFLDCLWTDDELVGLEPNTPPANAVIVEGIMHRIAFNPERLEGHRAAVVEQLQGLPDEFRASKGGGYSFLNAAYDRDGNLWGQHVTIDQLFSLGQGLGLVQCLFPRERWGDLPGGMPYYAVNDEGWDE